VEAGRVREQDGVAVATPIVHGEVHAPGVEPAGSRRW
jgi:hypothetical protein